MCNHDFFSSDYNTEICSGCGVERKTPIEPKCAYTNLCPLFVGYSRVNRFRKLLLLIFHPLRYGTMSGKCVVELEKSKPYNSMAGMLAKLQAVKSTGKNYNNLHMYAIRFLKNYSTPEITPNKKQLGDIVGKFSLIENRLSSRYPEKRFFSYRWVLTKLLFEFAWNEFIIYVKPIANVKSNLRYDKLYKELETNCVNTHGTTQGVARKTGGLPEQREDDVCESQIYLKYVLTHLSRSDSPKL